MTTEQPEQELEAAIWQSMTAYEVTCPVPVMFLDRMVEIAKRYAAGDSDVLTAIRRGVLDKERGR
jgi:hypothetical protein